MCLRVGILFLLVLGSNWAYANAGSLVISHVSVLQISYEGPKRKISEMNAENERLCTLCEQFAAQALYYLRENKTQTVIINTLHRACSRLPTFCQECSSLVDYYAPIIFVKIAVIRPEDFCKKVNICEHAASISPKRNQDCCTLCHEAMAKVLLKLKDPNTQIEIIDLLVDGCDKMKRHLKKCKKLVFEYFPLILANAEQFLVTHDICIIFYACKASGIEAAGVIHPFLKYLVLNWKMAAKIAKDERG